MWPNPSEYMYFSFNEAIQLFESMPEAEKYHVSWMSMVSGLAQNKMIQLARKYFHIMHSKDIAAWSAIITAYVDEEKVDEVCDLFIRARQK